MVSSRGKKSEEPIKLPTFETIDEAAEWAETHDTAPYFNSMEDVPPFELERSLESLKGGEAEVGHRLARQKGIQGGAGGVAVVPGVFGRAEGH